MAVLPIFRMGAEVLKRRAAEVTDFTDPALPALVSDMIETMFAVRGIGLAAPQVGASQRVVIFMVPPGRNGGVEIPLTVMINPMILPVTEVLVEDWEACLSVPGLTGRVPRITGIRYAFQDLRGQFHEQYAVDFHARVIQHECDHLDGMLYPMRMRDMASLAFADVLQAEAQAAGQTIQLDEEGIVAA